MPVLGSGNPHSTDPPSRVALALVAGEIGIWDWDLRTGAMYIAPILKQLLGYADHENPNCAEDWFKHVYPEDLPACNTKVERHRRGEVPRFELEHRMLRKDGSVTWWVARGMFIRDASGEPVRLIGVDTCIDALKQARDSAARSQRMVDSLQATMPALVYVYDFTTARLIETNGEFERMLGRGAAPPHGLDATWMAEIVHPEDLPKVRAKFDPAARRQVGDVVEMEIRLRCVEGRWRWVFCRDQIVAVDADGRALQAVGVAVDCTDRKLAEAGLQRSEEMFRRTIDDMVDGIVVVDGSGTPYVPYVNRQYCDAYGITPEMLHADRKIVQHLIHPEDRDRVVLEGDEWVLAGCPGGSIRRTYRVVRPDGQTRWLRDRCFAIRDDAGHPTRLAAMVEDITERRGWEQRLAESERMFRGLAERMRDVVFVYDRTRHKPIYLSAAFESVTGLPAEAGLSSPQEWLRHVDPRDRDRWFAAFQAWEADPDESGRFDLEYRIRLPSGRVRWLRVALFPIGEPGSDRFGGLIENITRRKRRERQQRRQRRALKRALARRARRVRELERQRAEQEKHAATGRLAARVAHEINNPLAGVKNAFRLVRTAVPADHPHRHFADKIDGELGRIADIVRQMFALYRPHHDPGRPVDLLTLARDTVTLLEPLAQSVGASVEVVPPAPEGPGTVVLSSDGPIRQVLVNVVRNALEVSPGGTTVRVCFEPTEQAVEVRVSDCGPGIPEIHRARVFEPFYSGKRDAMGMPNAPDDGSPPAGMGMGLAVARSLMESLGGQIDFSSDPGRGTTFRMSFPKGGCTQATTSIPSPAAAGGVMAPREKARHTRPEKGESL